MSDIHDKSEQEVVQEFLQANKAFLDPDSEIMRNHHIAPRSEWEERALAKGMDTDLYAEIRTQLRARIAELEARGN